MQPDHGDSQIPKDIIDEKSIHDKLLSALAVVALAALLTWGCCWQFMSLPAQQVEEIK